jgi:hypothetical protein
MGEDGEARARDARRRVAEIDASVSSLDPKWREHFIEDVRRDSAFERSLLGRQWVIMVVIFLLVLLQRLFT